MILCSCAFITLSNKIIAYQISACMFVLSCVYNHDVYFSQDSIGNSLLAIDLQWDLPDFANIGHYTSNTHTAHVHYTHNNCMLLYPPSGSNDISYCQESLRTAFESLHGFYRTGNITNHCLHLEDYQSLADIMTIEKHWPEVKNAWL